MSRDILNGNFRGSWNCSKRNMFRNLRKYWSRKAEIKRWLFYDDSRESKNKKIWTFSTLNTWKNKMCEDYWTFKVEWSFMFMTWTKSLKTNRASLNISHIFYPLLNFWLLIFFIFHVPHCDIVEVERNCKFRLNRKSFFLLKEGRRYFVRTRKEIENRNSTNVQKFSFILPQKFVKDILKCQ